MSDVTCRFMCVVIFVPCLQPAQLETIGEVVYSNRTWVKATILTVAAGDCQLVIYKTHALGIFLGPITCFVETDCVIQETHRHTLVTVVKYLRAAPVGVHVCLRRHTCFDPSSRWMFAASFNHLSYILTNAFSCSMKTIVASTYWAFVTPGPRFWFSCVTLSVSASNSPAISVYLSCASSNDTAFSRCFSTWDYSTSSPSCLCWRRVPLTGWIMIWVYSQMLGLPMHNIQSTNKDLCNMRSKLGMSCTYTVVP